MNWSFTVLCVQLIRSNEKLLDTPLPRKSSSTTVVKMAKSKHDPVVRSGLEKSRSAGQKVPSVGKEEKEGPKTSSKATVTSIHLKKPASNGAALSVRSINTLSNPKPPVLAKGHSSKTVVASMLVTSKASRASTSHNPSVSTTSKAPVLSTNQKPSASATSVASTKKPSTSATSKVSTNQKPSASATSKVSTNQKPSASAASAAPSIQKPITSKPTVRSEVHVVHLNAKSVPPVRKIKLPPPPPPPPTFMLKQSATAYPTSHHPAASSYYPPHLLDRYQPPQPYYASYYHGHHGHYYGNH